MAYKLSTSVAAKYAPLINRSRPIHEQTPKSQFATLREGGVTNIDLWVNGSLYPINPADDRRPKFQSIAELLEFVGDGISGLLGYTTSLCSADQTIQFHLSEAQRENQSLRDCLQYLMNVATERDQLLQFTRKEACARERVQEEFRAILSASNFLRAEITKLREECEKMRGSYEEQLQISESKEARTAEDSLQLQIDLRVEMESLKQSHEEKLASIALELKRTKATLRRRDLRLQKMFKTPYGYRSTVRNRRDVHTLAPNGGHAKRAIRLARCTLTPSTTKEVQTQNSQTGTKKRLCGSEDTQTRTAQVLSSLLTLREVNAMCDSTKLTSAGVKIANHYLHKIGQNIGAHDICETMDKNGITQGAYSAMYKKFKDAAKLAGKGLQISCLPNPNSVTKVRQMLNLKLRDYIGDYKFITDTLQVPAPKGLKTKDSVIVKLNDCNSLFADVEQVQRTMVQLYGITPTELQGQPLIFVIKIDEAEIVHAQKMERVSITLMNRALNSSIDPSSEEFFSVQAEREIWPIDSFQVPRENNAILQWVFSQTFLPTLIKEQEAGQLLHVPDVGNFRVHWHLAADMKSIKCMYGLSMGANSPHSCIYCMQKQKNPVITTIGEAETLFKSNAFSWDDGLFSRSIIAKPVEGVEAAGRWKGILPIPMDRVHICTLHAFNRIVEKIVQLHFIHVWTIQNPTLRKQAIDEMQKVVSLTGAHGGDVRICKDAELSGKSNNVPNKLSFSGAHALKLFNKYSIADGIERKLYIDVVNAEHNIINNGRAKRERIEMWQALDELRPYFNGLRLKADQSSTDFKLKVDHWGKLYVKCFGEHQVTHYMHVLVRHGPYFVERYGSLAVWSCQGMENSHHAAKIAYQ